MNVETAVILFAIATIFGLVGVVVVDIMLTSQEAEASRGCINPNAPGGGSIAFNASKGKCAR